MGTRQETYDEALARRLASLRAELTGLSGAAPELPEQAEEATAERTSELPVVPSPVPGAAAVPLPGRHLRVRPQASRALAGTVPGALLAPGPVAVVAVLLALGLAVTAWWALRSRPEPLPDATPVAAGLATPVAVPGSSASPAAPRDVVVHVAGKVRRPGIVVLEPGARVADALEAAGGPKPGADLATLNLARPLVDGEQVLVGQPPPAGAPAAGGTTPAAGPGDAGAKVNLNTATQAQLEELPGVGPVTAEAILAFRQEHGAFTSVDELLDVSGIGEATLAEIAPHATV